MAQLTRGMWDPVPVSTPGVLRRILMTVHSSAGTPGKATSHLGVGEYHVSYDTPV